MRIPPSLTRQSIAAHSWLGLMAGALMYAICLSGTVAVFVPELERWEQPYAQEFLAYDANVLEQTFNAAIDGGMTVTPHMYLVLPTAESPRARIASEEESWFLNSDGSLGEQERNHWSEMMLDLHLYLHLPESWGMILVSIFGAVLAALILSGLFAHRRLVRDAFKLRTSGARGVQQLDIHNRLSVWGIPFHLMIAITGAYFGLALPFLGAASQAFFDGDSERAIEALFGAEPEVREHSGPIRIAAALDQVREKAPDTTSILVIVHHADTATPHVGVLAKHPQRLIYSENYLFDANGGFLRTDGFSDGATGRQVLYSIYRLHFGYFGSFAVKVGYGILGLALTVVSVTGVNVWLARRKKSDALNDVWTGFVWGLPIAIVLSAMTQVAFGLPSMPIFWGVIVLACSYSAFARNENETGRRLLNVLALAMAALVPAHVGAFGRNALEGLPLAVNAGLLITALALLARRSLLSVARHRPVDPRRPGIDPAVEYPEPAEPGTPQ